MDPEPLLKHCDVIITRIRNGYERRRKDSGYPHDSMTMGDYAALRHFLDDLEDIAKRRDYPILPIRQKTGEIRHSVNQILELAEPDGNDISTHFSWLHGALDALRGPYGFKL